MILSKFVCGCPGVSYGRAGHCMGECIVGFLQIEPVVMERRTCSESEQYSLDELLVANCFEPRNGRDAKYIKKENLQAYMERILLIPSEIFSLRQRASGKA